MVWTSTPIQTQHSASPAPGGPHFRVHLIPPTAAPLSEDDAFWVAEIRLVSAPSAAKPQSSEFLPQGPEGSPLPEVSPFPEGSPLQRDGRPLIPSLPSLPEGSPLPRQQRDGRPLIPSLPSPTPVLNPAGPSFLLTCLPAPLTVELLGLLGEMAQSVGRDVLVHRMFTAIAQDCPPLLPWEPQTVGGSGGGNSGDGEAIMSKAWREVWQPLVRDLCLLTSSDASLRHSLLIQRPHPVGVATGSQGRGGAIVEFTSSQPRPEPFMSGGERLPLIPEDLSSASSRHLPSSLGYSDGQTESEADGLEEAQGLQYFQQPLVQTEGICHTATPSFLGPPMPPDVNLDAPQSLSILRSVGL